MAALDFPIDSHWCHIQDQLRFEVILVKSEVMLPIDIP